MVIGIIHVFLPVLTGFAHSNMEKTYPTGGEKLTKSPSTIEVWFQDPVVIHSDSIQLLDASGNQIELGNLEIDPKDKTHIVSNLTEDLQEGYYVSKINVIALDGYVIQEEFKFQIVESETRQQKEDLEIVKYSPKDGEIVEGSPYQIDLWFNQPTEVTAIGVFDDQQQTINTETPVVDPNDPNHVIVKLEGGLSKGTYQVTWYAHPKNLDNKLQLETIDVFYFAVDEFTPIQQQEKGVSTKSFWFESMGLKQIGYWFVFIGVSILFGSAFFNSMILRECINSKKWRYYSFILLLLVLIGIFIIFVLQKGELENLSLSQLLSLKYVWIPVLQIFLLVLGFVFSKVRLLLYGFALFLLPFFTGHAAYPRYGGYLSMLVYGLHLVAASIWIGGLFSILTLPRKSEFKEKLQEILPSFSKWALMSLIIIICTGLYMTNQYVPSFSTESFVQSEWGKAVLVKMIATIFILIIGFFQRRTIKRFITKGINTIITRAKIELVYAVFIVLFASLLLVSSPGAAEQGVYPTSMEKEGVKLDIDFTPLYPGLNVLTMDFEEKVKNVEVTLSMPPNYKVNYNAFKVDDRTFKITGNLLHAAGTMEMEVKAKKEDGEEIEYIFRIVIPGEMRFNE